MDEQLLASIKAIGIIQPPIVVEKDGALVINAGDRRVKQAIRADFATIDVLVCDADEARDLMRSLAENLIRASMNSVDIWRGIDTLEKKGWNEQAIADALALPLRTVKRLKLLAHLHPPMLDAIAAGSTPTEDQLRTIAAASRDEQAQVWKKHKPKKGHEASWYEIARALAKRRIPFSAAKFGDNLAQAYGVVWEDDLFAPAGEDGRYTTNVDGFFGAQQEWLQNNLPERGTLLPQDEYGRPQLPKKAENVYGTPGKSDRIGHYLDPYSGAVKTLVYRLPDSRKAKTGKDPAETAPDPTAPEPRTRPDVTQKGLAMIGDFRTDALHQASRESRIEDSTLLGLLVLALAGKNVSVQSGADMGPFDRERIAATITEGGVLTSDFGLIRTAARSMLVAALSCRDNMSNSGPGARIAGEAIGASLYLPTMATNEFLSCLSRQALEKAATTEGVRAEVRVRDTRARFIERFTDTRYVYPGALFQVTAEEAAAAAALPSHLVRWPSEVTNDGFDGDTGTGEDIASDADALAGSAIADMPPVD
jgi:ParB/RepB/Spo0J family partition protein